ncbi:MAG: DUF6567 family protein [Chryseosolibacter sp.]
MKTLALLTVLLLMLILVNGCTSTGVTASSHVTNVQLTEPNFRMVMPNVSGEAASDAILGLSFSFGMATSQVALIPLSKNRMLYQAAMKKLWENFEAANGPVSGRRLALTNLRYDSDCLNVIVYTKAKTVIVADVVEFEVP